VPAGAVEQNDSVGALGDMAGDLVEMKLHGRSVGVRQGECRSGPASRTDGPKKIGVLIALVCRLARSRPASGPLADEAVLLADARFVLEPDFERRCFWQISEMGVQRPREVFLKAAMVSASCPG